MFLSNLSIKRPVFATMMMVALMVLGLFSMRRLPLDEMPDVDLPFLLVQTRYPGAGPDAVDFDHAERRLSAAKGNLPHGIADLLQAERGARLGRGGFPGRETRRQDG